MAQPFRQSGTAPAMPANMITLGSSRPPIMFTVPSSQPAYGYSMASQPSFVPASVVYPTQLPNTQTGVPVVSVPSGFQGSYSPLTSEQMRAEMMNHSFSRQPAAPRVSAIDPSKLLEEHRKLEKERNFQLQQQRLKQFTIAGKKGSLNTDTLIDSIFGKSQAKKDISRISKPDCLNQEVRNNSIPCFSQPSKITVSASSSVYGKQQLHQKHSTNIGEDISSLNKSQKEQKVLDSMMLECSNLSGPQKAKTFQKPSVKELRPATHQGKTFAPSEKARDWSNVQGLDRVFVLPKPKFPVWCKKEHSPPLYHHVETLVTGDGSHPPDTNLLYPILISSGLQREVLGHIWELVNQTSPGHLTQEEMYAALALVAVAQAGHQITNLDILHQLPKCPTPFLQCFNQPQPSPNAAPENATVDSSKLPSNITTAGETSSATLPLPGTLMIPSDTSVILPSRPSDIFIVDPVKPTTGLCPNETVNDLQSNVSSWAPFKSSDAGTSSTDDDFDDFKSATPTAVGAPSIASLSSSGSFSIIANEDDDEFDDFKQAPSIVTPQTFPNILPSAIPSSMLSAVNTEEDKVIDQDLMSPEEDKYSVFRILQQNVKSEWDVIAPGRTEDQKDNVNQLNDNSIDRVAQALVTNHSTSISITDDVTDNSFFAEIGNTDRSLASAGSKNDDDEFGDFLQANTTCSSGIPKISLETNIYEGDLNTGFADFSKLETNAENFDDFNGFQSAPAVSSKAGNDTTIKVSPEDSEFGEFASSPAVNFKLEGGQEFIFHHVKDNISLAESQSVSSLELGTFDGGGHSGESKSSLSRQGSVPSLDLKGVGLEGTDNEDGFGEMQGAVPVIRSSHSPSPSFESKASDEKTSPTSIVPVLQFQSSCLPIADKYSVIRAEEQIQDEDRHVSDWMRCIQSCHEILQNATKIFNQMSCSSVCNEVLNSKEGENYVKNVIEVYRVVCRISVSSKSAGKQTDKLLELLKDVDQAWNTLSVFLTGSSLMPEETSLDFSTGLLCPDPENNLKACGVCLLSVDARSKAFNKCHDAHKLTYGGRQYHSTCANLWVNCVDPLLPVLTLPQLL